ncbi:MAG: radical SAM protein [Nanopusillaceae archaeon]
MDVSPRYAVVFFNRACPRECGYCRSRLVRVGRLLGPAEWIRAFEILRDHGVRFTMVLGNEVLTYPWIVELTRMLRENGFYGSYALYTTFPEPWYSRLRERLVEAGLYNISAGVDVVAGAVPDRHITEKSIVGLEGLIWFKEHGVPDVHATVTIHRHNYRRLHEVARAATRHRIWTIYSLVGYSPDGLHDFYGTRDELADFLIDDPNDFARWMNWFADLVELGVYAVQSPPQYFRELARVGGEPTRLHCSLPLTISVEADGTLRLCGYRPFYGEGRRHSVFELGSKISMDDYVRWWREEAARCPGCGWVCWYMAELWHSIDPTFGDEVFRRHASRFFSGW